MKSNLLIALFISMFGITVNLSAQEIKPIPQNDPTGRRLQEGMQRAQRKRVNMVAVPVEQPLLASKYNNRDKEILSKLNTESIPADFPVYKSEYTNEEYTSIINKWYSSNPSLLKNPNNQQ
ncbi:MAG: hypothetical protein ACXVPN_00560 [Bacteroidia bacterium]